MSSAKWWPFCLGTNVLNVTPSPSSRHRRKAMMGPPWDLAKPKLTSGTSPRTRWRRAPALSAYRWAPTSVPHRRAWPLDSRDTSLTSRWVTVTSHGVADHPAGIDCLFNSSFRPRKNKEGITPPFIKSQQYGKHSEVMASSWHHCISSSYRWLSSRLQYLHYVNTGDNIEGILPKGPNLPCVSMAGRALFAGYHWLICCLVLSCHTYSPARTWYV